MRWLKCLTWMIAGAVPAATGYAQLVEVGPGYVRAPFVRVYRGPGGVHVRAPFVSTYTPFGPRRVIGQPIPGRPPFADLTWQQLRQQILAACHQLDRELERFPSADFWRSNLKTTDITAIVSSDGNAPPTTESRRALTEILATYDTLGATPDFNRVAELSSFQMLHDALAEYVLLPEPRLRFQLASSSAALNQALNRFNTGVGWKDYLLVSADRPLSEGRLRTSDEVRTTDLADALARYDSAAQNADFATITTLPAFQSMHDRLASYLNERQDPSTPAAEELPPPSPIQRR